jgi:hypothetical protein
MEVLKRIQAFWDRLPKEVKVSAYMFVAALLDQVATDLKPEMIYFIPTGYRIMAFNLLEVALVETVKRLRPTK